MSDLRRDDVPLTVRNRIRIKASEALPDGSLQRRVARVAIEVYRQGRDSVSEITDLARSQSVSSGTKFTYARWFASNATSRDVLRRMAQDLTTSCRTEGLLSPPVVVVLPGPGPLQRTLTSLQNQVLQPCDVIDLSGEPDRGFIAFSRIIEELNTSFVMTLISGDELVPDAIVRIHDVADADPRVRLVTWDDDVLDGKGLTNPLFRPVTYSPDLLLSANPYGRSFAFRCDASTHVGGLSPKFGEDCLWDLLLRLNLDESGVAHVPRVLCHLIERPTFAGTHGPEVVARHLDRIGVTAEVSRRFGAVHINWSGLVGPRVSIIVPSRHNETLLDQLFESLRTTDYSDWELIVVDNGGKTAEHERFYEENLIGIDHQVLWWNEPFNYGSVNNFAAESATGDVLVLLNDDTVIRSSDWLSELTGWLSVPGVGTVGVQLIDPDGLIQHGGVIVGSGGLADHRFQGLPPHSTTIIGSTDWYFDSIANTAACVAISRDVWDQIGGLDERFLLCGSDVVVGMDVRRLGLRNVCTPAIRVDHMESATRKTDVPVDDIFASYWRYSRFLRFGDPYHNPNVSLTSREPKLRAFNEATALERVGPALGRSFGGVFKQSASEQQATDSARHCRATEATRSSVDELHAENSGHLDLQTVNWFVPDFDNPFYGGLATIFRIADHLRRNHEVENRFVVWGNPSDRWFRSGLAAIFPGLEQSQIVLCPDLEADKIQDVPYADVSIATQWQTAYQVAHFPNTKRKFYLIQDFEPMFNPAGTLYALAEETYKLGLLGLCNTEHLRELYVSRYQGRGGAFTPAVDQSIFHAAGRKTISAGEPVTIFVYARPGHWRNCWELVEPALHMVKERFGERVRIVTAGAWSSPEALRNGINHLGLLDYVETGALYRTCDVGLSVTVSEHPSYLPLELMACGVPVVAFDLPAGYWILKDGINSLLAKRTVDGLYERLSLMVEDSELRNRLSVGALETIAAGHRSWDLNLAGIHGLLSQPLLSEGLLDETH